MKSTFLGTLYFFIKEDELEQNIVTTFRKKIKDKRVYMEKSNRFALFLLMFNIFLTVSGIGLTIPVMPAFLDSFHAGGSDLGFLLALFAFGQFLFSPIAGNLSDRLGRKIFIIGGLILYGISFIIFGLASQIWLLYVARFLTGIGSAFVMPTIMAYVADVTSVKDRGKGMSLIGAAISFGITIGPLLGGVLSKVSITFPFFIAGAISIVAGILTIFLLPNATTKEEEAHDSENIFKQIARSVKTPYFVILVIIFIYSFGIANFQSTFSLYLDHRFNYTPTQLSFILSFGGFVGLILQIFIINKLFERFGEMKVVLASLILAAVSILLIIFTSGYFLITFVATLFSIATTFIRPAINTLVSKLAGREQGFAAGMNNAYMSLGSMIGPILAGNLFDWNMESPYVFGSIILAICFGVALTWSIFKAPNLLKPSHKQ